MNRNTRIFRSTFRHASGVLLGLGALAGIVSLSGCVASGSRERYYASRAQAVNFELGDQSVRVAVWPWNGEQRRALASVGSGGESAFVDE